MALPRCRDRRRRDAEASAVDGQLLPIDGAGRSEVAPNRCVDTDRGHPPTRLGEVDAGVVPLTAPPENLSVPERPGSRGEVGMV